MTRPFPDPGSSYYDVLPKQTSQIPKSSKSHNVDSDSGGMGRAQDSSVRLAELLAHRPNIVDFVIPISL